MFGRQILVVVFVVGAMVLGCNSPVQQSQVAARFTNQAASNWRKVQKLKLLVQPGDLVTRSGNDIISNSVRNFNKQDKTYSHGGIAALEEGEVYVYHIVVGTENPDGCMMRQPFDSFCNPADKNGVGLFRYNLSMVEQQQLLRYMKKNYKSRLRFDSKFDLASDSTMYCAEVILKGLKKATNNRVHIETYTRKNFRLKDPGFKNTTIARFEYVAIDNLFLNTHCREIARVVYN